MVACRSFVVREPFAVVGAAKGIILAHDLLKGVLIGPAKGRWELPDGAGEAGLRRPLSCRDGAAMINKAHQ